MLQCRNGKRTAAAAVRMAVEMVEEGLLTKEEAKFMLSFKKTRVPYFPEQLAEMNNMTVEETQKMLDHLNWVGVIESNRENPEKRLQYNVPIFVPGSAEFMMMNDELTAQHPNLATFFNLMTQMPLEDVTPMIPLGGAGVGMHVIPVEKAIEHENSAIFSSSICKKIQHIPGKISSIEVLKSIFEINPSLLASNL